MFCYFQVYSKVNQFYIHIHTFFFRFFPHVGLYGVLSKSLLVIYFMYSSAYMSIPISQFILCLPPPSPGNYVCFDICDSSSIL